jgi:low affinity Fe/Cu permease
MPTAPQARHERGRFDRFADRASKFVSKAAFFLIALVFVLVWIPTIFVFTSIDTWQLVINTVTSVMAFLLIALLQNSERRYDDALHHKVDAIAQGLVTIMRHLDDADAEDLRRSTAELRDSIGLEDRVGT